MYDRLKKLARQSKIFRFFLNALFVLHGVMTSLVFLLFKILPVKKNKIVCCSAKGRRYGDNPKYIVDRLIEKGADADIIWLTRTPEDSGVSEPVKVKKYAYFSEIYHLSTAAVWLDSHTKPYGTLKRKNQLYIQTWHGSYGLKKFGFELANNLPLYDKLILRSNSKIFDYLVSNSKQTTRIYRDSFQYDGEFLECGSPRNDLFFGDNSDIKESVCKHFNIEGKKIALYAPTYRNSLLTECYNVDFERLINTLHEKFGGEWVVLVRLHLINYSSSDSFVKYNDRIINASKYDVMQDLLVSADILLSDYSSCMFDFVTKRAPCFIYATDSEQYNTNRGCYFDLDELPFPVAKDNDELQDVIRNFDDAVYQEKLDKLFDRVGLCETGKASETIADIVLDYIRGA